MTAIEFGKPVGDQVRPFDRIDGDVDLFAAAADFLADEEHRRLVALAFADDDASGDLHLAERFAHLLDRRAVGGVALAAAHPARAASAALSVTFTKSSEWTGWLKTVCADRACHALQATKGSGSLSC